MWVCGRKSTLSFLSTLQQFRAKAERDQKANVHEARDVGCTAKPLYTNGEADQRSNHLFRLSRMQVRGNMTGLDQTKNSKGGGQQTTLDVLKKKISVPGGRVSSGGEADLFPDSTNGQKGKVALRFPLSIYCFGASQITHPWYTVFGI